MTGQIPPLPAGYTLDQQPQAASASAGASPAIPPLPKGYTMDADIHPGEVINDVGNKVIVPIECESFADTMRRAVAYGKTVSLDQINAEMATAPKKVAETLVAAPLIGAAIPAAEVGAAALPAARKTAVDAVRTMAEAHPFAASLLKNTLLAAGGAEVYKHSKWLMDLLP